MRAAAKKASRTGRRPAVVAHAAELDEDDDDEIDGRGGARAGAGRPRAALPAEVLKRIGPPPNDKPLAMVRWWTSLSSEAMWEVVNGVGSVKLLREIRATVAAVGKLVPPDIQFEAARKIAADEAEMTGDGGAEETPVTPAAAAGFVQRSK